MSTQTCFQLPAQMWLCLQCRPFKSSRSDEHRGQGPVRFEQALEIRPVLTGTTISGEQRANQWKRGKMSVLSECGVDAAKSAFCSCFILFLIHCCLKKQQDTVFLLIVATLWKKHKYHMWATEMKDLIQQIRWRGSRFRRALWRISGCWVGGEVTAPEGWESQPNDCN